MEVIDCKWEIENLKKRTVEIVVDRDDIFSRDKIVEAIRGYEYMVVKVPTGMFPFNVGLQEMGFNLIETQISVCTKFKDFNFQKVQDLYEHTRYEVVSNEVDFQSVVSMFSPGMFSTDRIVLDPAFGEEMGYQRYVNWMTTEYKSGRSKLIRWIYDDKHVGFMLIRIDNKEIKKLLGGLYKPFQGKGLGMLTPAAPLIYAHKEHMDISYARTCISSNNVPVVKLYSRLGIEFTNMSYVFVKHADN